MLLGENRHSKSGISYLSAQHKPDRVRPWTYWSEAKCPKHETNTISFKKSIKDTYISELDWLGISNVYPFSTLSKTSALDIPW